MSSRKRITYSDRPNHAARSAHARGARQFKTYDTSHIRPKKSKGPIIFSIVLALIVLAFLAWGGSVLFNSCSVDAVETLAEGESVQVTIPDGSGAKDIGKILQENKVIASSTDFANRVNDLGVAASLKPGTYTFTGVITLDEVIDILKAGPDSAGSTFTIPEGYSATAVAARVEEVYEGSITAEDFLACVNDATAYEADYPFVVGAYNNSLEGFLFPKTYPIKQGATADSVVRMMLSQYQTEIASIDFTYAENNGLSAYQVLIIASLIEREAAIDDDRPLISSVIYNRLLKEDMLLQIDASVAYAAGVTEITPDDLSIDSPYNTYIYKGLPPGPICSPGLASLQAAANPADTEYLYYVVSNEGDGSHYFSTTYEDHLAYIG